MQKVFRTGNSLALTVPAEFASSVGIRQGDKVQVKEQRARARIIYQFSGSQQLPLDAGFFKSAGKRKVSRRRPDQSGQ